MKVEVLSVGTEILLGDILNTNTHFLSKEMANLGLMMYHHTTVGDNAQRLKEAIETALKRVDVVITTGGLGPTEDDITVETVAQVFGKKVILHEPSVEKMKHFYEVRNQTYVPSSIKQNSTIEEATVIYNTNGFAPGTILEKEGKVIILLPGPPEEMKTVFREGVVPYLTKKSGEVLVSKTLNLSGIGESDAEYRIKDLIESQSNPTIAPYAKAAGLMTFRITAKADTQEQAYAKIEPIKNEIYQRLGQFIYGEDKITLEEALIKMLTEKQLTLSIAESMTGGMVTSQLISVPGASKVIIEGLIAYNPSSKVNRGLVKEETIKEYSVISEQVAAEMAQNIAKTTGADIGISTTGMIDVGGGESLAYLGLYYQGEVQVMRYTSYGNRERVRRNTAMSVLHKLRQIIM